LEDLANAVAKIGTGDSTEPRTLLDEFATALGYRIDYGT
jgi:hypothetical protein